MAKTIYALWSAGARGKTGTVKKMAEELHRLFPNDPISPDESSLYLGEINITIIIKGIKIALISQGDPGTGLYGKLENHAKNNCDILICTTRTRGETEQAIYSIERKFSYKTVWFTNYQSSDKTEHDFLNQQSALHVVNLIRTIHSF